MGIFAEMNRTVTTWKTTIALNSDCSYSDLTVNVTGDILVLSGTESRSQNSFLQKMNLTSNRKFSKSVNMPPNVQRDSLKVQVQGDSVVISALCQTQTPVTDDSFNDTVDETQIDYSKLFQDSTI